MWGAWWLIGRDDTAGIPATGGEMGQVEGDSSDDVLTPNPDDYDSKG